MKSFALALLSVCVSGTAQFATTMTPAALAGTDKYSAATGGTQKFGWSNKVVYFEPTVTVTENTTNTGSDTNKIFDIYWMVKYASNNYAFATGCTFSSLSVSTYSVEFNLYDF